MVEITIQPGMVDSTLETSLEFVQCVCVRVAPKRGALRRVWRAVRRRRRGGQLCCARRDAGVMAGGDSGVGEGRGASVATRDGCAR